MLISKSQCPVEKYIVAKKQHKAAAPSIFVCVLFIFTFILGKPARYTSCFASGLLHISSSHLRTTAHFLPALGFRHTTSNLWPPPAPHRNEMTHLTKSILLLMAAQWRRVTFSLSGCRTSKPASTNSLQRSKMPYLRRKVKHSQIHVQTDKLTKD